MSKPRPGVAAAKRLSKSRDRKLWELVESQYRDVLPNVKGLKESQIKYEKLGQRLLLSSSEISCIEKEELLNDVVAWKFHVGKPRPALMKHLRANTKEFVREQSALGIEKARSLTGNDWKPMNSALEDVIKLKGVGPATASALLSLVRPDAFAYMYDEAIDCFLSKRTYTMATYRQLNNECLKIAEELGTDWNTARVAKVLWTAARANAYSLKDHTVTKRPMTESSDVLTSKRQKTSTPQKRLTSNRASNL